MDNLQQMDAQLWEYIDGMGEAAERNLTEQLIRENQEWRSRYQELLEVHQSIGLTELEQPSLRFTKNVMEEIAKYQIAPATRAYINNRIIWGIGLFFITMIIGFLVYGVAQIDWSAASDSKSTLGVDLGKVDYSRMFNSAYMNVIMMMNVVLGFLSWFDNDLGNNIRPYKKAGDDDTGETDPGNKERFHKK